jgi:hypothetical protein
VTWSVATASSVLAPLAAGTLHERLAPAVIGVALALAAAGAWSAGRSDRPGRLLRGVLRVALVAGLSLALADTALRPLRAELLDLRPHERFVVPHPTVPGLERYRPGVSFRGRETGDLAAMSALRGAEEPREMEFATDAFGFRNEAAAADAEVDVLVLGDSYAVGSGTTQGETFSALLAARSGLRVYDLAFVGSPWHQLLNLELEAPRLRFAPGARLVWMLFEGNDLDESYGDSLDANALAEASLVGRARIRWYGFRQRSPARAASIRLWHAALRPEPVVRAAPMPGGRELLFYAPYAARVPRDAAAVRAHANFARLRAIVAELRARAAALGLEVVVAIAPSKERVYGWVLDGLPAPPDAAASGPSGFARAVGELCAGHGMRAIDLGPPLAADAARAWRDRGELLWWYDDTHWNARGHRAVAELLAAALVR